MIYKGNKEFDELSLGGNLVAEIYKGARLCYQSLKFNPFSSTSLTHQHGSQCWGTTTCGQPILGSTSPWAWTCPSCGASNSSPLTNYGCPSGHYDSSSWYGQCACGFVADNRHTPPSTCQSQTTSITCTISSLGYASLALDADKSLYINSHLSGVTVGGYRWTCNTNKGETLDLGTTARIKPRYKGTYRCVISCTDNKTGAGRSVTCVGTTN